MIAYIRSHNYYSLRNSAIFWHVLTFSDRLRSLVYAVLCRQCLRVFGIHVWHNWFMCVTWLIYMCDMPHPNVWLDFWTNQFFLLIVCVTLLICVYDITYSYVWHDSSICMPWLVDKCDVTCSYLFAGLQYLCVPWLIYTCDVTHS